FFFSSRRRHTRSKRDWSSDVCSSDLIFSAGSATKDGPCLSRATSSRRYSTQPIGWQSCREVDRWPPGRLPRSFRRAERRESSSEIGRASCRERVVAAVVGRVLDIRLS